MALSVLIADDEPTARQFLRLLLDRQEDVSVVGEAENGAEALEKIEELKPDLVFLDIRMPEMTGLEVARALEEFDSPPWIVFATGYDEYAVEAFDAAAIDYLMKPYEEERLEKTLRKIANLNKSNGESSLERQRFTEEIARIAPKITKIPLKAEDSIRLADPDDILLIQARGRRVYVKTRLGEFAVHHTVTYLEQRLNGWNFFRANEGCLVNLDKVKEMIPCGDRSYELRLTDKEATTIELSRSRSRALREMIKEIL
jgi:DNA-binding LytR/AlgR family response regulator